MDNAISIFKNEQFGNIRVIEKGTEFLVVARDIMRALGYNPDSRVGMIFQNVPDEWKGVNQVSTPGGTQEMLCLSEQGLYFFLGRSDKPAALPFQKWLAGEVLPAIRKDGGYIHTTAEDDDFTILVKACNILKTANEKLQAQIADFAPKAALADSYLSEGEAVSMAVLAKKLQGEGIDIGQNRLFDFLRGKGVLVSRPGVNYNTPTQKYAVRNWFDIIQPPPAGQGKWKPQIRVTPKGVVEISKRMHELFGGDME